MSCANRRVDGDTNGERKAFSPEAETLLKEAIAEYTQIFTK